MTSLTSLLGEPELKPFPMVSCAVVVTFYMWVCHVDKSIIIIFQASAGGLSQSVEQPAAVMHGLAWLLMILLVMFV